MITYTKGNLLSSNAQALVNTVNTVGVMGKGIALQFKEKFPGNFSVYKKACGNKELKPGKLLVVKENALEGDKWIINFPTKKHWKGKSKYEFIEEGLKDLVAKINDYRFESVALPPLGCGNGGLEWSKVRTLIEKYLKGLDTKIIVYEPNENIKEALQENDRNKKAKLTPARAMLLYLLFHYESSGEPCSLFIANKLAYFLQRSGEKLRLKFEPYYYGPYSVQVGHVLYYLNGVFLNGLEQNNAKPFEPITLNYKKLEEIKNYVNTQLKPDQILRLENVINLIKGFETTFSLELLATVDFLLSTNPSKNKEDIIAEIADWSRRKTKLFKDEYIHIAHEHLKAYQSSVFANT